MANNFYADNLVPDTNAFVIWEGDGGGLTADVAIAFDNGATKAIFSTSELSAAGIGLLLLALGSLMSFARRRK